MHIDSLIGLVGNARGGCRESMDCLSTAIQDEIYTYIYRLTLNEDLAHDLRQETLLQMVRSLGDLQQADRFKPWVYKIAWAKVQKHYRSQKNKRCMSLNDHENLIDALKSRSLEGLKAMVSREIAETMVQSIVELDVRQRSILILRCYENLSYSEIAAVMNCSETATRVLFFRAKQSLKTKLQKKGILTGSMFLGVLGLFGQATSPANAAVTVAASTLQTGALAATIGCMAGKFGMYLLTMLAGLGILTAGILMMNSQVSPLTETQKTTEIKSFHYTEQSWKKTNWTNTNLLMGKSLSKGGYEQWYFFPEGIEGPMFLMTQRWDPTLKTKQCGWLLDGDGQKYYHSGQNQIYLMNSPLGRKQTLRFPCDSEEFCNFLDKIEGPQEGVQYKRDENGLLIELRDNRFENAKGFRSDITYNRLDEKTFDSFRYNWPDAEIIDERDDLHKQGWTNFEIQGTVGKTAVWGQGRMPFIYNKHSDYPPLLKIRIGTERTLIDCPAGAYVLNRDHKITASYPAGSFFRGLMRPWYGIHTIDTVRRDAAERLIPFAVENLDYDQESESYLKRRVTLQKAPGYPEAAIALTVDMDRNRLETVEFRSGTEVIGKLDFIYPNDPAGTADTIELPEMKKPLWLKEKPIETLWLFKLLEERFGES